MRKNYEQQAFGLGIHKTKKIDYNKKKVSSILKYEVQNKDMCKSRRRERN